MRTLGSGGIALAMAALLMTGCASGRGDRVQAAEPPSDSKLEATGKKATKIVTQPARDVGVAKTGIPEVLVRANESPYSFESIDSCEQIAVAVRELNEVLGPDFALGNELRENRAGKIAEAGGKTIVNAIIPFRGLVREITGAAPAQRRLNAAIDAGYARRGFLRGLHYSRGCRPSLSH